MGKRQTRLAGLDDKILALYAGGITVRDISAHLAELYDVEIGRDTISRVTDAVLEDVAAWRTRPLERAYPIVYFDAMFVKFREDRSVRSRACYLAMGVTCDGDREVLGLWWQETEGAKFWLAVLNDLRRRGVEDVLISCVDGLKGFPEAIEATFPQTWVQTCIVHLIRSSLRYVNYRDRKRVARALRPIYTAANADAALAELDRLEHEWGERYPPTVTAWRASCEHVIPFLALPDELRRAVYTNNTIEGLHRQIRKAIKARGHFPDQQHQADLPSDHQGRRQVAAQPHLVRATRSPQDPLRRPIPRLTINPVTTASHTEDRTLSLRATSDVSEPLAVHDAIGDDGSQASTPEPGHHLHNRMRSYDFPDSSASVTVSDLPDGRRRVSVDAGPAAPATPLFIAQHECETNYPLELIELVLDVKGPGWVCDEISREERPDYVRRALYWTICSHIDESEAAGRRILDYGCGSGASTMVLARMFPRSEIVGIDIDARSLDIARARLTFYGYENVTFRLASSASSTPEELGRFHFVTFTALYEHLLPDERRSILPAVWRSLEPGGVLFVAETPHRYWPIEAHTTGLPLINYLPDTLTLRVVRLAARRGETGRPWSEMLRAGIRGGTEEQLVAQLAPRGAARPEVLRPTRLGLRDEFDLWYAISGSTGRRRVKRALASMLRALKRLTGISLVPYIAFAVRKSTNPVNTTPATSPGPLAA